MERFYSDNEKVRRCQIAIDWLETINSADVLDSVYEKAKFFTDKNPVMW